VTCADPASTIAHDNANSTNKTRSTSRIAAPSRGPEQTHPLERHAASSIKHTARSRDNTTPGGDSARRWPRRRDEHPFGPENHAQNWTRERHGSPVYYAFGAAVLAIRSIRYRVCDFSVLPLPGTVRDTTGRMSFAV
jgi:hypothetical protein